MVYTVVRGKQVKIADRIFRYLYAMQSTRIKEYLLQIADRVTPETTLEDIYNQLALLADIEESENEAQGGKVFTQDQVEQKAKEWLK